TPIRCVTVEHPHAEGAGAQVEASDTHSVHRQPDVVLGQSLRGGARTRHIIQFGELTAPIERMVFGEPMQHRGHPPRKALHLPYAPEAGLRVGIEQITVPARTRGCAPRPRQTPCPRAAADARASCPPARHRLCRLACAWSSSPIIMTRRARKCDCAR